MHRECRAAKAWLYNGVRAALRPSQARNLQGHQSTILPGRRRWIAWISAVGWLKVVLAACVSGRLQRVRISACEILDEPLQALLFGAASLDSESSEDLLELPIGQFSQ